MGYHPEWVRYHPVILHTGDNLMLGGITFCWVGYHIVNGWVIDEWMVTHPVNWTIRWKTQFDYEVEDQESDDNHCFLHFINIQA